MNTSGVFYIKNQVILLLFYKQMYKYYNNVYTNIILCIQFYTSKRRIPHEPMPIFFLWIDFSLLI